MRILLHRADGKTEPWLKDFSKYLPEAEFEIWHAGEKSQPCDYAVVWSPPEAMLPELAHVKAIFNTGAGVDARGQGQHLGLGARAHAEQPAVGAVADVGRVGFAVSYTHLTLPTKA